MKRALANGVLALTVCASVLLPWAAHADFSLPDPIIKIPGVTFTQPIIDSDCAAAQGANAVAVACYDFPWIGQYLSGLYTYAVYVAAVAAAIVIMVGGFLWLTAGGNANRVSSARGYISGALLGFGLMLGSYTILKLVNPKLVVFSSLNIPIIAHVDVKAFLQDVISGPNGASIQTCSAGQLNNTDLAPDLQSDFNNAATQFGIPASFLAALGAQETNGTFNPNPVSGKGAAGVMQIEPYTASDIWDRYAQGVVPRPAECQGVTSKSQSYPPDCLNWMKTHNQEVIMMSAAYVKGYIEPQIDRCSHGQYSDNMTLVAAAYNGGVGKNSGTLCATGQTPDVGETQTYVHQVNGYDLHYCSQSGGQSITDPSLPSQITTSPDM